MAGERSKTALTERSALMVSVTAFDVPEASPSQREKEEPGSGVAVSVTDAPPPNVAVQALPQLIPAGFDVIVPEPKPIRMTFKSAARTGWASVMMAVRPRTRARPTVLDKEDRKSVV